MKLWQKDSTSSVSTIQKQVEEFTIGSDKKWDLYLAEADIKGSLAHATMLQSIGLLSDKELLLLKDGIRHLEEMILIFSPL